MTTGRHGQVSVALGLLPSVAAALGADEAPWQRLLGGEDATRAKELQQQINTLQSTGQFGEAAKPAEELLALRERRQGAGHWQTADARRELKTLRKVAALPEAARRDIVAAGKFQEEALALEGKNRHVEAEGPLRKALAIHRKYLGEQHARTALSLNYLAGDMYFRCKYADAAALHRQALEVRRKVLGELHPDTAWSLHYLAGNLMLLGR